MLISTPIKKFLRADIEIAYRIDGCGPPLLLLHGHPQTHVMWHKVWPTLAERFTLVAPDLRGYGDSGKPAGLQNYENYSKRAMAIDAVRLMQHLGHAEFAVLAHDRGARVAHRLALDHPRAVTRMMLLDIAPTLAMYRQTTMEFARAYFHWFWLVQPAPFPERMIESDPEFYVRSIMGGRFAGLKPFHAEALAEYCRCARHPGWAHGICEDYRASIGIDIETDEAELDAGHRLMTSKRVLWGAKGAVGKNFDVMALWKAVANNIDGRALECGHYIAEELPEMLLVEALTFFASGKEVNVVGAHS
jgi:haloacetate dehalogenase